MNTKILIELARAFGYLLLFVGIIMIIYSSIFHSNIERFKSEGVKVNARIIEKWENKGRRTSTFYVRVSYVAGGTILEGGKMTFATIQTNYNVWSNVNAPNEFEILYLPSSSEEAMFVESLQEENFTIAERREPGFILFTFGVIAVVTDQLLKRQKKQKIV